MTDAQRRLFLIPPGAPPGEIARLADALNEAINVQNRLAARSPYILRFTGVLEQSATAFSVEHEPATAFAANELFESPAAAPPEEQLLRTAAAVLDALAAAHTAGGGHGLMHGGLCPGVILTGADGLIKVADFGFAPAICKTLGVESYLNLAVGPQANASGGWEVLAADVSDRDDRICAFVDPDKYGQEALATFEAGSDVVAAGIFLHLLADHRHPYLYFEPQAHRVVDMARMMSFGVPCAIHRKDLSESTTPGARAFCAVVGAMLARMPGERPSARDALQKLVAAAPAVDPDVLKAERWVQQLDKLLAGKQWHELGVALKDAPDLKVWPDDLRARAGGIRKQFDEYVTAEGRRAAVEAELQAAQAWFERFQSAVTAADWEAAEKVLGAKPAIEHWPDSVEAGLPALVAKIEHARAVKKARAWHQALQRAYQVHDWAAVGRRFAQRPAPEHCPPEVLEHAATVAAEYQKYLEEQERLRREIERQHAEVRAWLDRARSLTDGQEWVAAIDLLGAPPQLEHWPKGSHEEAVELTSRCRHHLGDAVASDLDAITENIRRQGETAVREVLAERLTGLLHPDRVETSVDLVMWAPPETDADGRAPVVVRLRAPVASGAPEAAEGELDFHLRGNEPRICRGLDEFRKQSGEVLTAAIFRLQGVQLRALEAALRASIFPDVLIRAELAEPSPQLSAEIQLLGAAGGEGVVPVELRWSDGALAWTPANWGVLTGQALELARTISQRVVRADLLKRSALLQTYDSLLGVSLVVPPGAPAGTLPKTVSFDARVGIHTADRKELRLLHAGTAVCDHVGEVTCDADIAQIEAKLNKLIVAAQETSRQALYTTLKQHVRSAPVRIKVDTPARSKTPIDEAAFAVRAKTHNPVTLSARWNSSALVYQLPAGWEKAVEPLMAPPPAPPPRQKVPRAPRTSPSRRGLIAGATALGLTVVAGGVYVSVRGSKSASPTPPPSPVEVPVRPPEQKPLPTEVPSPSPKQEPPVEQAQPPPSEKPTPPPEEKPPPVERPVPPTKQVSNPPPEQVPTPPEEQVSAPPPKQTPPEEPPPPPPPKDLVQSLRDFWEPRLNLSDSQGLSINRLFGELIPATAAGPGGATQSQLRFLTAAQERVAVSNLKQEGDNRVTIDVSVALKGVSGTATQTFAMSPDGDGWQPDPGNVANLERLADAAKQAALQAVGTVQQQLATDVSKGDLNGTHTHFAASQALLEPLAGEKEVTEIRRWMASLPPTWSETEPGLSAAGYSAEGETNAATGYPSRLKDRQGNVLVCVSVPPSDELWGELKGLGTLLKAEDPLYGPANASDTGRAWQIYYIDTAAAGTADFAQARAVAKDRARGLPTRDEWFLAVLKMRAGGGGLQELTGGLWQWCDDPAGPQDGRYWLCGGSRLLVEQKPRELAMPRPGDDLKLWWNWLTNPLVMQRRQGSFGDQLTGVRTVLRIHPRG